MKNSNLGVGQSAEPGVRQCGEAAIVRGSDVLTASTTDEAADLRSHYGARAQARS